MYDVIIIGSGPAGISAALYTQRGGLKTLIISKGSSSLEKAHKIQNYYGLVEEISGKELYKIGIEQAKKIEGNKLKSAFGWFVLVMGIYILIKELFL